jgi:hypothetical protein
MKAIFILITTLIIGSTTPRNYKNQTNASLGSCDAELSVEKNISSKQAWENGTMFTLTLKNTSTLTTTYKLSTINLKQPCDNKSNSTGTFVPLDASFKLGSSGTTSENEITLNSGKSAKFSVKINMIGDVSNGDWGCVEIEAQPKGCNEPNIKTVLSVYVPNPQGGL